ncbi:MAG: response regulator [Acidimicrobiales bacterium]
MQYWWWTTRWTWPSAVARACVADAVDVAGSGQEALDALGFTDYDLVCLDLTMPGIDGIEVCCRCGRGRVPSREVLMLTRP